MRAIRDLLFCSVLVLGAAAALAQTDELTKEQAEKLTLDAVALYRSGDLDGALSQLERPLAFYRSTGDKSGTSDVLYARGVVLEKKGERPKALESFKESLALHREIGEDESQVLHDMAFLLIDMDKYAEAAQAFEEERALYERAKDRKSEGEALHNLGFIAAKQEKNEEALAFFDRSLLLRREAGDREGEASTLDMAAFVRTRAEQTQGALDFYEKALLLWRELGEAERVYQTETRIAALRAALARKDRKPPTEKQRKQSDQAHELNTECSRVSATGNSAAALPRCEKSLELFRKAGDRVGEAMALATMSFVYFQRSDYARTEQAALQGLKLARETEAEVVQANALNILGLVYMTRAQYPQALTYFRRAMEMFGKYNDLFSQDRTLGNIAGIHIAIGQLDEAARILEELLPRQRAAERANVHLNLGSIRAMQKDFAAARKHFKSALALQQVLGDPLIRTTISNLGALHAELGEYKEALEIHQQVLEFDRKLGDRASECSGLAAIAEIHARQNDSAKALEIYQQALACVREISSPTAESAWLFGIGRIYEGQGKLQQALDTYQQAIAIQETIRAGGQTEEIKTALAERSSEVYARLAQLLVKLDRGAEAFDFSERARARTFLDQLGNTGIEVRVGGAQDLIEQERIARLAVAGANRLLAQEKAKPRAEQDGERIKTLSTQLATKRREYADVLSRLKLSNAEYASLVTISPLKLAEVQKLLEPDTTLLSYFVTADATTAFIVTRDAFKAVELKVSEKDLRTAVEELRAFASVSGAPSPALARLSTWIIDPLLPHLSTPFVGIVPHGVLHLLPFAALRGKEPDHFLGEDYTLFHLPTVSALPLIQQKHKAARGELLALAQGHAAGLAPLRYAEKEAQAVAELFGTSALVGGAATETALRERAANAGMLHIAAHGQLNAVTPLFSRLVLAIDDDLETTRDGSLEVREIYGLDLKKASLVVLSACQTQLGAQSRGDDVVGLSRAFIYAGSPAVLASLWSVDDVATAKLMIAFYRKLKEGLGGAAALRAAQAETRREHPDPYYWASFVLTGDPR